jgi:uroporphyrinogen decarboxylase
MNMNNWIEFVLQSKDRLAIPLMTHPGIELAGEKILTAVNDGEIHYRAIKSIQERFNPAVSVSNIMMDLTVEAEAFGSKINFYEDEVPSVSGRIVFDDDSIKTLKIPDLSVGRIPQYLKAAELAATNISDRPVFAGCIGPFSLAGRLFDLSEIMTELYTNPDGIKILLEKCSQFLLPYIKKFKEYGANGIIMAEPAAGLLSGEMCDEFSSVFIKPIADEVQDENFLFILHNCGNTGQATQSMLSTGAKALHLGNKIDIVNALKEVPEDIVVMGNLDPVGVFKLSTADKVYEKTMTLLKETKVYKNYIISTGCDTPPGVPMKNVEVFFEAVKDYNKENNRVYI